MSRPKDDHTELAAYLAPRIAGEVRFDPGSRAMYATDSSNYRQVPIGVVVPRHAEDVIATMEACRKFGVPVLSRGGGTSLAGQTCNVAVVIDFSKYMNAIESIDREERTAWVQPGCVLDWLRDAAEKTHLTFGPDPSTHSRNTLGGMIGNNSCGVHSVMAGRTADNVEALDILLYDGTRLTVEACDDAQRQRIIAAGGRRGQIYRDLQDLRDRYADLIRTRFPHIPRRVSGYCLEKLLPEHGFNVAQALVGSEGTCVTILRAKVKLVHSPPARVLAVLGFPDVYRAGDAVPHLLSFKPVGLEGIDDVLVKFMREEHLHVEDVNLLPEGHGWLLVEFGGETTAEAEGKAHDMIAALKRAGHPPSSRIFTDPHQQRGIWIVREAGLGATAHAPNYPRAWEGWEDSAVPPDKVGPYLRDFHKLLDRFGYKTSLYGHFGDGCIHCRITFDLETAPGIEKYRRFVGEAADLVLSYGGSLSGEHGDGQSRAELLGKMYGPELLEGFRAFKRIWDPDWKMNPGKVVDPAPITSHLRLGAGYEPPNPKTVFAYPDDKGSFGRAVMRCVGVSECRRSGGGVMCPSYMVTHEERYSTRGRAKLLWEMLNGGPVARKGWESEAVREALDLCLACKGCKSDCPVNVDMAKYKAEFSAHYYRHRLRPRSAYSMGLIQWWSRAAMLAPQIVNGLVRATAPVAKAVAGIASQRRIPRFAKQSLRRQLQGRATGRGKRVILFADTFTNAFLPESGVAAFDVLGRAGYSVEVPQAPLCCARPLYAIGMLDLARKQLARCLDELTPRVSDGTRVVVLEPACVSSFRDELPALFPKDARAQALAKQVVSLEEFLAGEKYAPPPLKAQAVVHMHCHEHALIGAKPKIALLDGLGVQYRMLNAGCCGMAGSFGFEAAHYDVSMAAAERALLPALRQAAPEAMVIANGYSCREQIYQATGRRPLHMADVLRRALETHP